MQIYLDKLLAQQPKRTWSCQPARGISLEIVNWTYPGCDMPCGIWNYYMHLFEQTLPAALFEALVMAPTICPDTARVTYEYYGNQPYHSWQFHGGVTAYDVLCSVPGHRHIVIGCDYNHLWDHQRGRGYILSEVAEDALQTAKLAADYFGIRQRNDITD